MASQMYTHFLLIIPWYFVDQHKETKKKKNKSFPNAKSVFLGTYHLG